MPLEPFKNLIEEIGPHLMFMLLLGYGEPLLNPQVFDIIAAAKRKDVFVVMGTNATLLTPEGTEEMVQSGLDLVVIALDATSRETYEKYRVGGDFDQVLQNVRELAKTKARLRAVKPIVDIQFVALKENESELQNLQPFVSDLGADKYSIRKVVSYSTHDPDWSKVKNLMPSEKSGYVHRLYASSNPAPKLKMFCAYPYRHAAVNWDGAVIPCCKDIDARHVLGNAFEGKPFKEIWNSDRFLAFRSQIKENIDCIDICQKCNRRVPEKPFLK